MDMNNAGVIAEEERVRIRKILARYPDITAAELEELKNWFDRVASALDVGLIATDPSTADQYHAFKAKHIDGIKPKDIAVAAVFLAAIALAIGLAVALVP